MTARPILRVARVTLEAVAPLSLSSGAPSLLHDVLLARAPNGLPTIPGASLAGVLRAALGAHLGKCRVQALFGTLHNFDALPGCLTIGDALSCGQSAAVIDGLGELPPHDPIFSLLRETQPILRDHVRLNAHGAVDGAGKFTRAAVPRGTRFIAQIEMWDSEPGGRLWRKLLDALRGPVSRLRIGGATRAGYGGVKIAGIEERDFDMRDAAERQAAQRSVSLSEALGGVNLRLAEAEKPHDNVYLLYLVPDGPFRFGQGAPTAVDDDPADLRPIRETVIDWGTGNAPPEIVPGRLFIPASAVKGALRHRTVFHHRRRTKAFVGKDENDAGDQQVSALFGRALDSDGDKRQDGEAGCVFIDDIPIPDAETRSIARTAIDRFSGGVMRKALFTEEAVESIDAFPLRIEIAGEIGEPLRAAFEDALADLAHGWLALGASGTKGLGIFKACDLDPESRLAKRFKERFPE